MNKKFLKKNYVTTAVALLLLAGCSNDIKAVSYTHLDVYKRQFQRYATKLFY